MALWEVFNMRRLLASVMMLALMMSVVAYVRGREDGKAANELEHAKRREQCPYLHKEVK